LQASRHLPDSVRDGARLVVQLPTELVVRYRAVDRELVPSAICDTPEHLDALTESIWAHGIQVPLRLGFNTSFGFLDGNHRIAVAVRLGLPDVPVELVRERPGIRRDHGQRMRREDLAVNHRCLQAGGLHIAPRPGRLLSSPTRFAS
jgi:hypothetical protein